MKKTIFIVFIAMASSCSNANNELIVAINEYYAANESDDWEKVYSLRTDRFKKAYDRNYFISEMERYDVGWKLVEYKIKSIEPESDRVKVNMRFVEVVAQEDEPQRQMVLEQEDIWVNEDNSWRLLRASSRAHLPFTE